MIYLFLMNSVWLSKGQLCIASEVGIDDSALYHLYPLSRSFWFKIISLLLVSHRKNLTVQHYRRVFLQFYLTFLLTLVSIVVHQLRSRIQNEGALIKITKEHLFLDDSGQQNFFNFCHFYLNNKLLWVFWLLAWEEAVIAFKGVRDYFSQSIPLKKGWSCIYLYPLTPLPNLFSVSFTRICLIRSITCLTSGLS